MVGALSVGISEFRFLITGMRSQPNIRNKKGQRRHHRNVPAAVNASPRTMAAMYQTTRRGLFAILVCVVIFVVLYIGGKPKVRKQHCSMCSVSPSLLALVHRVNQQCYVSALVDRASSKTLVVGHTSLCSRGQNLHALFFTSCWLPRIALI